MVPNFPKPGFDSKLRLQNKLYQFQGQPDHTRTYVMNIIQFLIFEELEKSGSIFWRKLLLKAFFRALSDIKGRKFNFKYPYFNLSLQSKAGEPIFLFDSCTVNRKNNTPFVVADSNRPLRRVLFPHFTVYGSNLEQKTRVLDQIC